MKKLFLKALILSLFLSNLSFKQIKAKLNTSEQAIIGTAVGVIALTIGIMIRDYKKTSDFINNFDSTFGNTEKGGISNLTEAINQKLLSSGITQEEINKLTPDLTGIIKDLRKNIQADLNIMKKTQIIPQDLIKNTNVSLKKSMADRFKIQNADFTSMLQRGLEKGTYGYQIPENYFSTGLTEPMTLEEESQRMRSSNADLPKMVPEYYEASLYNISRSNSPSLESSSLPRPVSIGYGSETSLIDPAFRLQTYGER